jgi:hypothetical protein
VPALDPERAPSPPGRLLGVEREQAGKVLDWAGGEVERAARLDASDCREVDLGIVHPESGLTFQRFGSHGAKRLHRPTPASSRRALTRPSKGIAPVAGPQEKRTEDATRSGPHPIAVSTWLGSYRAEEHVEPF